MERIEQQETLLKELLVAPEGETKSAKTITSKFLQRLALKESSYAQQSQEVLEAIQSKDKAALQFFVESDFLDIRRTALEALNASAAGPSFPRIDVR
jgi:hypothetical protein